jgi:hypothetical protein
MAVVHKKTWPEEFALVLEGKKNFDLRVADFAIAEGDVLVLEEWDPMSESYTGRSIEKKVGFVKKFNLDEYGQAAEVAAKGFFVIELT